jgi:hypothetical protein
MTRQRVGWLEVGCFQAEPGSETVGGVGQSGIDVLAYGGQNQT